MRSKLLASLWLASGLVTGMAHAASVPVGFADKQIAEGFTSPTSLTVLPDGRVLVVQQNGLIRVVKDDQLQDQPFWQVPDVDSSVERGCLGITPDPGFTSNHIVFIFCTIKESSGESHNHVMRVTEADGKVVDGSAQTLLVLPKVTSTWHMGGALHFAPDGKLFVAVGNHEDDPQPAASANSQNLKNPFGKLLRINPDGSFPTDNPYNDTPGAYKGIWAHGFRNPFSFSIQPDTGRVIAGDVGQATWEELDDVKKGADYGWPEVEGPSDDGRFEKPLYSWNHNTGACSVTGVAFYNPLTTQFPGEYVDTLMFEDFCLGTIDVLDLGTGQKRSFVKGIGYPTNMVVAPDGSIYYMSRNQDTMASEPGIGTLGKIVYTASEAPRISKNPVAQTVYIGNAVTFEVGVEDADTIQWQRDNEDIPGATGTKYTIDKTAQGDDGASFRAVASNGFGTTTSVAVRLTITNNQSPVATISQPDESLEYAPGGMLTFVGSATDAEDGDLPAGSLTWVADFQHDSHTHPLLPDTKGNMVTIAAPDIERTTANISIQMHLTARDGNGGSHSVTRRIFPTQQLSALTPVEPAVNGSGPMALDRSSGNKGLILAGLPYPKGLGVAAPAEVRYDLGADGCTGQFVADVGVDDEVGKAGSVVFQVFLDDEMVYDSGTKRGGDPRSNVAVDLSGRSQIRLVVTDGDDGSDDDHADWGGARITGCSSLTSTGPGSTSPGTPTNPGTPGTSSDAGVPVITPVCGNGKLEGDEDCEDGNLDDGDCCSARCKFEQVGNVCGEAGMCSGPATCDGLGSCLAPAPESCVAQDACHKAGCDPATGECMQAIAPLGTPCGDSTDSDCTDPDTCDAHGVCVRNDVASCCKSDDACDDLDNCTTDSCDPGKHQCVHDAVSGCKSTDAGTRTNGVGTAGAGGAAAAAGAGAVDAGVPDVTEPESGCGCSVPGREGSSRGLGWLALLALTHVVRVRRKRGW